MRRIGYWKILAVIFLILGSLALLIPSPLAEPNFQGAPVVPIMMFVLTVTLYALVTKHDKMLYATIAVLVIISAYTGFWFYNYKMPLSSLVVTLSPIRIGNYPSSEYFLGNQCDIYFDLTIRNPASIDTPPFMIQNINFYINDVKLEHGTYSMWGWGRVGGLGRQGAWYYDTHVIVKANQSLVISRDTSIFSISIYSNYTKVEDDNFESIWQCLIDKNFSLSISGFFTSRPNFKPGDYSWQSLRVLATAQFSASCSFSEA